MGNRSTKYQFKKGVLKLVLKNRKNQKKMQTANPIKKEEEI